MIDGRERIVAETSAATRGLRDYTSQAMAELIASPDFIEALPGHLPADAASQRRLPSLRRKLTGLAKRSP